MTDVQRRALVTGASGGIGLALARTLAREGWDLVLAARSVDKLTAVAEDLSAGGRIVSVYESDLSEVGAPRALHSAIEADGIAIDAVVNNAGFATFGEFAQLPVERELALVNLNVGAVVQLTGLFLPQMLQRGHGYILNVASTAAFQPGPLMADYYASKAYVLHFTEALANELAETGVTATALCPGPTVTGFQERASMEKSKLLNRGLMTAERVAQAAYAGMIKGKPIVIPGFRNKLLSKSYRFVPRRMVTRVVRGMQEEQENAQS